MADQDHGIDPSRRDVIKKTAWAVPAIASFSLVNASPAAGAYSGKRREDDRPNRPGHGSNQTYPGHGSNQTYPGHGSNQTFLEVISPTSEP